MDFILALLVGAAAGYLAGKFTKGSGFGVAGNLVVGILGAFVGRLMFGLVGFTAVNLLGPLISATCGAVVLLAVIRAVKKR